VSIPKLATPPPPCDRKPIVEQLCASEVGERGCNAYLFGVVKIGDGSPKNLSAIHVLRHARVVRKLSLAQIAKLPADAEGYHILVVK
jgi:hypothetical protein